MKDNIIGIALILTAMVIIFGLSYIGHTYEPSIWWFAPTMLFGTIFAVLAILGGCIKIASKL